MPRRNIEIPKPHLQDLSLMAGFRDVTLPQLVRDAIREMLERNRDELALIKEQETKDP